MKDYLNIIKNVSARLFSACICWLTITFFPCMAITKYCFEELERPHEHYFNSQAVITSIVIAILSTAFLSGNGIFLTVVLNPPILSRYLTIIICFVLHHFCCLLCQVTADLTEKKKKFK